MSDTVTRCEMPPVGWTCSRDNGHDGPCAASPDTGSTKYERAVLDAMFGQAIKQRDKALAERDALNDEVDRLKANQMPDGGEWRTEYGQFDVDFGETVFFERTHKEPSRSDDMKRRVWYGPVEPIPSQSDSAASDHPAEGTTEQTGPKAP